MTTVTVGGSAPTDAQKKALADAFNLVTFDPASGTISDSSVIDKTLTIGRYADQEFTGDDWTLSATGLVCAQRGYLKGVELLSGSGVTLLLQDSPDVVAGRRIWQIPATSAPRRWDFPKPLPFHTGLFATIGGTSPSVKFILGGSE